MNRPIFIFIQHVTSLYSGKPSLMSTGVDNYTGIINHV